jgi:hypothetical protein
MRKILIVTAMLALLPSVAFADDIMAPRYGNTVIATDANGVQTKLYYAADGTFTGKQDGQGFNGTWKIDASNTICLTFAQPVPGTPNPLCTPTSVHKVGDTWSGAGRTVTLVQGIQ